LQQDIRTERLAAAVKSQPMFRGLPPADQERIIGFATLREHDRGGVLWNEGDRADSLTIILKGRVKIVRHADASDVILEIFNPGEPVGALAVYNDMPYPATAICMEPTTLLSVPRADYFELLERRPDLARAIIRELTRLTVSLMRKLQESRGQRVETRIAKLFLTLAERMGRATPEGIEIPLRLSRQEVAEMVGTTVETTIRTMSRWGREGVMVTGEGRFVIPSREKLEAIAEGGGEG
jgi:CRP/FNR family transcriptional regulator, nitrogen oxide reductase regulator